MANNSIQLNIDRRDVSVDEFTEAAQALAGLVREVISEMGGDAKKIRWLVQSLRGGSAYLEFGPDIIGTGLDVFLIERAIRATGEGLAQLDDSAIRPQYFNDRALRRARDFVKAVNTGAAGRITVGLGPVNVIPTQRITANVEELVVGRVRSFGSVDGKLVTVSMKDGYRLYIEDRVRGRRIECRFGDQMLETVLKAFGRRVIVRGYLWSRHDGEPQRIDVKSFEVVEPDEDLPRASAVMGILSGTVLYADEH